MLSSQVINTFEIALDWAGRLATGHLLACLL